MLLWRNINCMLVKCCRLKIWNLGVYLLYTRCLTIWIGWFVTWLTWRSSWVQWKESMAFSKQKLKITKGSFVSAVLCSMQKELAEILTILQCITMKNIVNHLMSWLIYYEMVDFWGLFGFFFPLCSWYSLLTDSPELARQRGDPNPEPQCPIWQQLKASAEARQCPYLSRTKGKELQCFWEAL